MDLIQARRLTQVRCPTSYKQLINQLNNLINKSLRLAWLGEYDFKNIQR